MLEKGHEAMTRKRAQKIVSTRGEAFFSDMELTERMKEHATFCALMIYLLFFLQVLYHHLQAHQAAIISPEQ